MSWIWIPNVNELTISCWASGVIGEWLSVYHKLRPKQAIELQRYESVKLMKHSPASYLWVCFIIQVTLCVNTNERPLAKWWTLMCATRDNLPMVKIYPVFYFIKSQKTDHIFSLLTCKHLLGQQMFAHFTGNNIQRKHAHFFHFTCWTTRKNSKLIRFE